LSINIRAQIVCRHWGGVLLEPFVFVGQRFTERKAVGMTERSYPHHIVPVSAERGKQWALEVMYAQI
jgi:hypothetical protein